MCLSKKKKGDTPRTIIQREGLKAFRKIEEKLLYEYLESVNQPTILALGGGTLTIENLSNKIKKFGTIIYLKADINLLVSRLIGDTSRPLLLDKNQNPLSEIGIRSELLKLLHQRKDYFEQAQLIVEVPTSINHLKQILGLNYE